MSNHPHTVTVGETFMDVAVEITLKFTDAATGFGPQRTLGEELASRNNAIGRAVRESLRAQLAPVADKVNDAVWTAHIAEDQAADQRRAQATVTAIQTAKDETAKKYDEALASVEKKNADAFEKAKAVFAESLDALTRQRDEAKAALAAKTKRSTAAKAGHAQKARRTKKGGAR